MKVRSRGIKVLSRSLMQNQHGSLHSRDAKPNLIVVGALPREALQDLFQTAPPNARKARLELPSHIPSHGKSKLGHQWQGPRLLEIVSSFFGAREVALKFSF